MDNDKDKLNSFMKKLEFNENMKSIQEESEMRKSMYIELARDFKAYFDSLIAQGFNEVQALALTANYQTLIWNLSNNNKQ